MTFEKRFLLACKAAGIDTAPIEPDGTCSDRLDDGEHGVTVQGDDQSDATIVVAFTADGCLSNIHASNGF